MVSAETLAGARRKRKSILTLATRLWTAPPDGRTGSMTTSENWARYMSLSLEIRPSLKISLWWQNQNLKKSVVPCAPFPKFRNRCSCYVSNDSRHTTCFLEEPDTNWLFCSYRNRMMMSDASDRRKRRCASARRRCSARCRRRCVNATRSVSSTSTTNPCSTSRRCSLTWWDPGEIYGIFKPSARCWSLSSEQVLFLADWFPPPALANSASWFGQVSNCYGSRQPCWPSCSQLCAMPTERNRALFQA